MIPSSNVARLAKQNSRPMAPRNRKMFPAWNDNTAKVETRQSPNGGAFVHMGKTGGSTLSVLLRNGCHSFMPHPCRTDIPHESMALQQIESYYHVPDFPFLQQSHHMLYLMTLRDPFDRTISAFVFEHIRNRYARNETVDPFKTQKYEDAYTCFPTLQIFVEPLGDDPTNFKYPYKQNWVSAESCTDLAKAAFNGRVKIYNHLFFSFQRILSFIPEVHKQMIYAMRQEHLWHDWTTVNEKLGQSKPVSIPEEGNRIRNMAILEVQHQLPVTRDLNPLGAVSLCNALKQEYRAYFRLLKRAKNLSPDDLEQSIAHAKRNCPSLNVDDLL
jgi:Sulfotransferase family